MHHQSHIIQRQFIEVEFIKPENAMRLQNEIAEVFHEKLQPRMEALMDELFGENYYASVDKLEIDCGVLNINNWEQELIEQVTRKLKEELVQLNKKYIDTKKVEETTATETFFFFLKNGFLPWNKRVHSIVELEQLLTVNERLISQLKGLIVQHASVAERLPYQFSEQFVLKIIAALVRDNKDALNETYSLLEDLSRNRTDIINKHVINAGLLSAFAGESKSSKQQFAAYLTTKVEGNAKLVSVIKEAFEYLPDGDTTKNERANQTKDAIDEKSTDSIYINNAGIVLLHPFLQALFEELQLTEKNSWVDKVSQHKAVSVLAFLATGNEEYEEFDVVLNKVLCNMEIDEVVVMEEQLNDTAKAECESLLNSVIRHWSVLKNTSIEGLREAFLQRSGKLSKIDSGWLLQVEQKTIDILLGRLPWGIGLIKLPWMNEMLFTEWA